MTGLKCVVLATKLSRDESVPTSLMLTMLGSRLCNPSRKCIVSQAYSYAMMNGKEVNMIGVHVGSANPRQQLYKVEAGSVACEESRVRNSLDYRHRQKPRPVDGRHELQVGHGPWVRTRTATWRKAEPQRCLHGWPVCYGSTLLHVDGARERGSLREALNTPQSTLAFMATINGDLSFDTIPDAIEAFARGDFVVVLDSPNRENEGDLIIAAQDFTPAKAAFLVRHSSGYVCAPITPSRAAALELPQMVGHNTDPNRTAYTITIDAGGVTTGISATDRSLTCITLADPQAKKESFRRPGHVVPLQAREGGVRSRQGHTEAAIDLCRLAGKEPVGVIAELVEDGEAVEGKAELSTGHGMMKRDACLAFARKYGLKTVTIEDLIRHLDGQGKS
nr:3,4-dihydroxy-2-butanone 4-phosphate synthase [Quercus suber]